MIEGSVFEVLKFLAMMFCAIGGSTLGTSLWTPNELDMEPETSLKIEGSSISVKDRIKTKKAISKVAMSANVAIQAGAIEGHGSHSPFSTTSRGSTNSTSASVASSPSRGSIASLGSSSSLSAIDNYLYTAISSSSLRSII